MTIETTTKIKIKIKKPTPGQVQCSVNRFTLKGTYTKKAELVCFLRNQVTTANPSAALSYFGL